MPPNVTITAQQLNGVAGGNASFVCTVLDSIPTPNITWMVNGTALEEDNETTITGTTSVTNSTLTLTSLDSNNTGNYSCMASNFLAELRNDTSDILALSVLCELFYLYIVHNL